MKYSVEIDINLPINQVISLFDSFDNLSKWQPTLKSYEYLEGEPGKPGAKTRLIYDENGREVEMIETIITRDLPDEFSATYEAKNVVNTFINKFSEISPNKTRWFSMSEFKFSGLMKIFSVLIRPAFPKQTLKDMNRFKEFAEGTA